MIDKLLSLKRGRKQVLMLADDVPLVMRIIRESEFGVTLGGLDEMLGNPEAAIRNRDEETVRVLLFSMVESYNAMPAQKAG